MYDTNNIPTETLFTTIYIITNLCVPEVAREIHFPHAVLQNKENENFFR